MSDKVIAYPALFRALHDDKDTYLIKFPDLPNTFTEGYGLEDAYLMASDVLAEMNYDQKNLPKPSELNSLKVSNDEFIGIVTANLSEKKRAMQKFVRKNVTVPTDLAKRAEDAGLNFSATLTEALEAKLG
ncbi:type II toxin-antitoxin system HicB family antitoxin [Lacticaseibacillus saniviri]|nr:type II toxin-antitoxin system HicB family antitoxin [Lacticaseibacillus saniviri]